jgi:NtrC-family two-component system response regulator AlgB
VPVEALPTAVPERACLRQSFVIPAAYAARLRGSTGGGAGAIITTVRVLLVDDEKNIRATLAVCLEGLGCQVTPAATAQAAMNAVEHRAFDVAFVDLRLGAESGLDLVPRLLAESPSLMIVVVTAYATVETAVEAMRRGAWDYLPKPFSPGQIEHLVRKAGERQSLWQRVRDLESRVDAPESELASESPAMRAVLETAARAAASDASVLLRGESGTGNGVLARFLHARSARAAGPFVVTNCPTLSDELLASELFGHARGSFTGAVRDQPGRVEAAEGGTLFLDEIGEVPTALQAKLLRFLQERDFERLGETRTRHADVRVVAATNRDLEAAVRAGAFREDLLYRLNVVEIAVPALRDRPEDILPMARRFLQLYSRGKRKLTPELSPAAEAALCAYAWPGNVRELRNAIERAVILWPAQVIEPAAFPGRLGAAGPIAPHVGGDFTLDALEREHVLRVLGRTDRLDEAAAILGIDASTLWRKRRKYDEPPG